LVASSNNGDSSVPVLNECCPRWLAADC
jgi:hypothetical protein